MLELVVIAPLVAMAVEDHFERGTVPLHLTVLPNVRLPLDESSGLVSTIRDIAAATDPITATAAAYASFGQAGDVSVTTVEPSAELRRLHAKLLVATSAAGAVPLTPAYNGDGYRPHITHTPDRAVHPGESVELTSLAVLDCSQPTRRISTVARLSGGSARSAEIR